MGVPYFKIKDSLKDMEAVACSANLTLYRDLSRRVFEIMRAKLSSVEQYSIDEAFFLVPPDGDVLAIAAELQAVIVQSLGLPVSIGIGQSKTQAKFANRCTKQTGQVTIWGVDTPPVPLTDIPLGEIWGIGSGLVAQFRGVGLLTVADLLLVPADRLRARFGVVAVALQSELAGRPVSPVRVKRAVAQKSLMSSRTFNQATTNIAVVQDALTYHINQVGADMRQLGTGATYLKIWVRPSRFGDYAFQGIRADITFDQPVFDTHVLLRAALGLLMHRYVPGVPYQKVGVMVAGLAAENGQLSLLETPQKSVGLWSVVDALNQKFATGQVWLGTTPAQATWRPKRALLMPSYTTQWKDVPVVSAS